MGVCVRLLIGVLLCGITLSYFAITRMGIGTPFSSVVYSSLSPILPSTSLDIVAELEMPPGNIAVSNSGRIFFNFHPEYSPEVKIAELVESSTSSWKAYPDISFQKEITTVLSMRIDSVKNLLWLLDFGMHSMITIPCLVAISLETDAEVVTYYFPSSVAGRGSMLNDFAIDVSGKFLYIADTSILAQTPAIIVYSVEENTSYRLLSSLPSLYGQSSFFNIHQHSIGFGPIGMKINVDSIALSRDNKALYFSPLTGSELLCVDVSLIHAAMCSTDHDDCVKNKAALTEGVQIVLHDKPITDGISTDEDGNVWLTALAHSSIGLASSRPLPAVKGKQTTATCRDDSLDEQCQLNADVDNPASTTGAGQGACRPLSLHNAVVNTDLLRWADGFSFGPDGLYITNSALYMKFNNLPLPSEAPYHILKLKAENLLVIKEYLASRLPPQPAGATNAAASENHPPSQVDEDDSTILETYMKTLKSLSGQ